MSLEHNLIGKYVTIYILDPYNKLDWNIHSFRKNNHLSAKGRRLIITNILNDYKYKINKIQLDEKLLLVIDHLNVIYGPVVYIRYRYFVDQLNNNSNNNSNNSLNNSSNNNSNNSLKKDIIFEFSKFCLYYVNLEDKYLFIRNDNNIKYYNKYASLNCLYNNNNVNISVTEQICDNLKTFNYNKTKIIIFDLPENTEREVLVSGGCGQLPYWWKPPLKIKQGCTFNEYSTKINKYINTLSKFILCPNFKKPDNYINLSLSIKFINDIGTTKLRLNILNFIKNYYSLETIINECNCNLLSYFTIAFSNKKYEIKKRNLIKFINILYYNNISKELMFILFKYL